eukprot:CAMPEP_0117670182 /NCGR_PEP_ID=MMETSP0804-20121206/12592_1 /TAXON_ID=1074897 /ORGANISM="Tetraselmis astigmatica, Strain CCMP880" /LENGTH=324 /DNA_ID=CAMNT_0005478415 /DNA_START=244 /DNA_END=1218 /DNA_ORIENTATION=+
MNVIDIYRTSSEENTMDPALETTSSLVAGDKLPGSKRVGRRRNPPKCRVVGCNENLAGLKEYHIRYKICPTHHAADVVRHNDLDQRFCQQCAQFHELAAFDGLKHSCRERLEKHNKRRRKQSAGSAPENNPSEILKMLDLRSSGQMGMGNPSSGGLAASDSTSGRSIEQAASLVSSEARKLVTNATLSFSDLQSFSSKPLPSYSLPIPKSMPSMSSSMPDMLPDLSCSRKGIVITTGSGPGSFTSGGSPSAASAGGVSMLLLQQQLLAEMRDQGVNTASEYVGHAHMACMPAGITSYRTSEDSNEPASGHNATADGADELPSLF